MMMMMMMMMMMRLPTLRDRMDGHIDSENKVDLHCQLCIDEDSIQELEI
jgi:hypothetical protein